MTVTTTTPPAPRTKRRATREDVAVLATVTYDRDASTAYNELYRAQSDSEAGKPYEVRHDVSTGTWACHQCIAASFGRECRHVRRAKRLRLVRWYSARLIELTTAELLRERGRRQQRVDEGFADEDDHACIDAITLRLRREGRVAA